MTPSEMDDSVKHVSPFPARIIGTNALLDTNLDHLSAKDLQ